MTTIGTAVLQIIPSLKGVSEAIEKQIDGKVVEVKVAPKVDKSAAAKAGKEAGEAIAKETKAAVSKGEIGKAVTDSLKTEVKKSGAGKEIAKTLTDDVKRSSPGREIAKVIVDGLAAGVKQGLPTNSVGSVLTDKLAEGIKQGIETKGLGTQIVGSISRAIKSGNLAGSIKDAVLPGIKDMTSSIGTQLTSGASEWSSGIAGALRAGDIEGAAGKITDTVVAATDRIGGIADAFGLPGDAIRRFGTDASGDIQGVVDTISGLKGAAELAGVDMDKAFMTASKSPGLLALGTAISALVLGLKFTIEHGDTVENPHTQTSGGTGQPQLPGAGLPDGSQLGIVPLPPGTKVPDGFEIGPGGQLQKKGTPAPVVVVAPPQTTTLNPNRIAGTPLPPDMKLPNGFELGPDGTLRKIGSHKVGGLLSGPGTGVSDSILLRGSNGEFMVNADATRKNLPLLEIINSGKLPGFAGGGLVTGDQQLRQIIMQRFGISDIGGYRPADKYGEHSTGRALDVMVGNNKAKGDAVKDFALQNASAIDLKWAIWRQHLYYPGGGGYDMPDRGSPTQNHMDHVHIFSGTGITNGLRGALTGGPGAGIAAGVGIPSGAAVGGPGFEDTSSSDQTAAAGSSSGVGGVSLASSISGLGSFGLNDLGSGVGKTSGGSDLSLFGKAGGSAIGGQISSALGVFGVGDSPGWLQAASKLIGGVKVGGHDPSGVSDGSMFDGSNLFGSGRSAAPVSATSTSKGTPPPDDAVHGARAGQAPGPQTVYNIRTATVEDAFLQAQRKQDVRTRSKLDRF